MKTNLVVLIVLLAVVAGAMSYFLVSKKAPSENIFFGEIVAVAKDVAFVDDPTSKTASKNRTPVKIWNVTIKTDGGKDQTIALYADLRQPEIGEWLVRKQGRSYCLLFESRESASEDDSPVKMRLLKP